MDALFDLAYCNNKVSLSSQGHLVTSLDQFNDGMFVIPLCLHHPGARAVWVHVRCTGTLHVQSGYNSKGINTMLTLEIAGQRPPAVNAGAQTTNAISSYVLVEATAQLRIGQARQLAVCF